MLDVVNEVLSRGNINRKLDIGARKDITSLDFIINSHPNKEEIFGTSDWKLTIPEEGYRKYKANNNRTAAKFVQALKELGYTDVEEIHEQYNCNAHLHLGEK